MTRTPAKPGSRHPFGLSPLTAFWSGFSYQWFVIAALAWSAADHAWGRVAFFGTLAALDAVLVAILTGILILDVTASQETAPEGGPTDAD